MTNLPHLLYVTSSPFWHQNNGMWARCRALIQYLSYGTRLEVLFLGSVSELDRKAIVKLGLEFNLIQVKDGTEIGKAKFEKIVKHCSPDVCLIDSWRLAGVRDVVPTNIPSILDTHDLLSLRTQSMSQLGLEYRFGINEEEEARLLESFDAVMCIQRQEYEVAKRWIGEEKVLLASHPCEADPLNRRREVRTIGLVASNFHANVDGLNNFILNVWPLINSKKVELHVFGNVSQGFGAINFNRIYFHGYKSSLRECYELIDIVVNPVRYGSGLKIKSIEALSFGRPLVSTPEGASGLSLLAGKALIVAESNEMFADAIDGLMIDEELQENLVKQGIEYILKEHTPEVCFSSTLEKIRSLC